MKHNYTTFEKIGLTLLITGSLLTVTAVLIVAFKADALLGIILFGLFTSVLGALMLLR